MFNERKKIILANMEILLLKILLNIKLSEFTTSYRGFNLNKLANFDLES